MTKIPYVPETDAEEAARKAARKADSTLGKPESFFWYDPKVGPNDD